MIKLYCRNIRIDMKTIKQTGLLMEVVNMGKKNAMASLAVHQKEMNINISNII